MKWSILTAIVVLTALFGGAGGYFVGSGEVPELRQQAGESRKSADSWKRKAGEFQEAAGESLRAYKAEVELSDVQLDELRKYRSEYTKTLTALRVAESELSSLRRLISFRSPRLTKAVRDFVESAHKIESVYSPNHENHFAVVMQAHTAFSLAVEEAIKNEGWPLADDGMTVSNKARTPSDALRAMSDALRRYESGDIDGAEFIEAQADLLEAVER